MAETVAELDGEDLDENDLAAIAGDDLRSLATEDQKVEPSNESSAAVAAPSSPKPEDSSKQDEESPERERQQKQSMTLLLFRLLNPDFCRHASSIHLATLLLSIMEVAFVL